MKGDNEKSALDILLSPFHDRLRDPFLSSFFIFELIFNWEIVLYVLDFSLGSWERLALIENYVERNTSQIYLYPVIFTLIYYFLYLPYVLPKLAAFKKKTEVNQANLILNEEIALTPISAKLEYAEKLRLDEVEKNNKLNDLKNEQSNEISRLLKELKSAQTYAESLNLQIEELKKTQNSNVSNFITGYPKPIPKQLSYSNDDFKLSINEFSKKHDITLKQGLEAFCEKLVSLMNDVNNYYPNNEFLSQATKNVIEFSQQKSLDNVVKLKNANYYLERWLTAEHPSRISSLDLLIEITVRLAERKIKA